MHKIFVLIKSTEVIVIFLPRDRHYIIISYASCSNTYPFLGEQFRRKIPNKLTMERRAFFLFSRRCLRPSILYRVQRFPLGLRSIVKMVEIRKIGFKEG